MRISTKVSLSLTLLAAVIFGGLGALQIQDEKRDLERAFFEDATTLCRTTAESLRYDLPVQESAESRALLRSLERFDDDLTVVLWRPEPPHVPDSETDSRRRAWVDAAGRQASYDRTVVQRIVKNPDGTRAAIVASPIEGSSTLGAVVLVHPLDAVDQDLRHEALMTGLGVLAFSVVSGVLGFALGEVYIARPLARLDRAMSAVAAGNLDAPALQGRGDEVGRVLRQFDQMRGELGKARARLEAEQDAHRATLERLVHADRLVSVGQLAAGLAHEIGSPLQILHGRARKLADRSEGGESVKIARIIVEQTERITRIVEHLLQFARPRPAKLQRIDPARCIEPVLELLELEAKRRGARVSVDAPRGESARVDPDALQQIVFNLVRNGLAALDEDGCVDLRVRVEEGRDSRMLELTVRDDGVGMTDEVRERLFAPFFTTRAHEGGRGLGLTVVHSLVEGMGGTIDVTPRKTRGTTFIVRIPC